jgi:hypothetical protein
MDLANLKSIALVEMASHNEVLRSYMVALLAADCTIICCTTNFNHRQLYDLQDDKRINWLLKNEEESNERFFGRIDETIRTCNALIVTTIDKDLAFFSEYKFPTQSFLVIHHYHAVLEPLNHFYLGKQSVKHYLKIIRYFLRNQKRKVERLISNYDGLILPSAIVREYARTRPAFGKYNFLVADFCVHESERVHASTETIGAIVPGAINSMTRDYDLLVQVMKRVVTQLQKPFTLTLLGKPQGEYGQRIVKRLSDLDSEYFTFRCHKNGFIQQKDYDAQMKRADFLILPINRYMKHDVFKEISSQSAVSGNVGDMVRYSLPAILPSHYRLHSDLEQMVGRYESEADFCRTLSSWINLARHRERRGNVDKALRSFSPREIGQFILSEVS